MADIAIFRVNYKSDFIITLESDAGWATPFCIKFWTDSPQRAFYVQYDGETYTHCAPVAGEPTKLMVQMDDHHLGVGDLKYQIVYHFTVADFPNDTEDEVLNQAAVIIGEDGQQEQVMLDLNGETAPEIAFSLPAYANEQQRIANEQQRIANEQQRIANETERVIEFAEIKTEAVDATNAANAAASLANENAQLADDKAQLADSAASLATAKAQLAQEKATYAQTQGDYAKAQGDTAQADHVRAEADHTTAAADHTQAVADTATAASDHTQAASDHTRAESDHTRAESDHAAVEVYVDSLGAFDISAYHATGGVLAKYADLTAALGTDGANIPDALRKGGMSVKFVLSSDNKYVQYRFLLSSFNIYQFGNPTYWQGEDNEPINGSNNLVKSGGTYHQIGKVGAAESIPFWEFGQITITDSGWTYLTPHIQYCRISEGLEIALENGDEIIVNNPALSIYIGIRKKDGTYTHVYWTSAKTTMVESVQCVIVVKKINGDSFSASDLAALQSDIEVKKYTSKTCENIDNIIGEDILYDLQREIPYVLIQGVKYKLTASINVQFRTRYTYGGSNVQFLNLKAGVETDFIPSYTTYVLAFYAAPLLTNESLKIVKAESIGYKARYAYNKIIDGGVYNLPLWLSSSMKLIAHAGYFNSDPSSDLLENSSPAFIKAGELGMYGCECDIQVTSDGKFVCMHDSTVDRTTNGTGNVSDFTLAELRELRLKKEDRVTDLLIPTLEEYLLICKKYGMIALLETKNYNSSGDGTLSDIVDTIKSCGMSKQTILQHSCYATTEVRAVTDMPFSAIYSSSSVIVSEKSRMVDGKYFIMTVDKSLITSSLVSEMHNLNIPVFAYTFNLKSEADTLMDMGVDGIICNGINKSDWNIQ